WELVVVDNGSSDGTLEYFAGVQDVAPVPVTVVANGTNRGFPAAINQGLQLARGDYLVMLNNDVVVTDGWLDQLISLTKVSECSASGGSVVPPLADPLFTPARLSSRKSAVALNDVDTRCDKGGATESGAKRANAEAAKGTRGDPVAETSARMENPNLTIIDLAAVNGE